MKKSKIKSAIITVIGLILSVAGILAVTLFDLGTHAAPYVCIGLGCGLFGQGLGELITRWSEKKYPEITRQREIEENDERNIALRDKAQAKAYRIMMFVFGSLTIAFALMNVELRVILLLVAAYLYICGCSVYFSVKFRKEM